MPQDKIVVVGAREHNLKNITVEIPRDKLVVITGLSGSGKSSLAFDTIFAEGQRRYVESLSAYARQFLGQMEKPDVDHIDGLSPAVSIDQKGVSRNPRSTVGTVTEVYDYLRLLFARVGVPHCPICGREVRSQSAEEIVDAVLGYAAGTKVLILAPVIRERKGHHQPVFEDLRKSGFTRARVNGRVLDLSEEIELDRYKQHSIEAVVDRLVIPGRPEAGGKRPEAREVAEAYQEFQTRLTDSVETALKLGNGTLIVADVSKPDAPLDRLYSEHFACPFDGISLPDIEPRTFSFNTPHGACPSCQGLGLKLEIDPDLVIPNRDLSVNDGGIAAMEWRQQAEGGGYYWQALEAAAHQYHIPLDQPIKRIPDEKLNVLLFGTNGDKVRIHYKSRDGRQATWETPFEGIIPNLRRRYDESTSDYVRDKISEFMAERPCEACGGKRLRAEALAVTVAGVSIITVTGWPVLRTLEWAQKLKSSFTPRQQKIAQQIIKEITARLKFLVDVGLDYLTLGRTAATLSGGEAQRIRLATQIGSQLMGVLYVLDEPSIGLHQRDNARLIRTLQNMRDLGNTLLVVEHDDETILSADWVVDLGPGAGEHGGKLIFEGTVAQLLKDKQSITGAYLSGRKKIELPERRRPGNGHVLVIRGAKENNLKDIDVEIPLGKFVCLTGVSGSGKSSLLVEVLYKRLAQVLHGAHVRSGAHAGLAGVEQIDKIINIDQSPIGRTPRSNPGTYVGVFDEIRALFAGLPESKVRGYKSGRFSFNVKGGRCEACQGQGQVQIEMQFLPDIFVPCDVCHGARFNRETLQVRFKGKNIADLLDTSIGEAVEFFDAHPAIQRKLKTLQEVGLGYIRLGQPATTLSGGEAQRTKLAKELSKRSTGRTLYVLDEPSVGLHAADVHKLVEVLQRFVDEGNTVLIIEHHPDIIKVADWLIDLGPEGGDRGGYVVATGTPEDVAKVKESYTGQFLKKYLNPDYSPVRALANGKNGKRK
ncbi:MAG: excinuclease ABC subunit UvrA [Anaerolineales bacterium]|nr:excinuclease ABC subunit UvrA [Anaerolineales bacterium]